MIIRTTLSPIIFQTGPFQIRWYGALIAFAVALSYILILHSAKRQSIDESSLDTIFIFTIISGIIGARLGFVIQNLNYFLHHFADVFKIWDGGLSIQGAMILGAITLYFTARAKKLSFYRIANLFAPYLMLSGAIGRWGNYFNQEIIGRPSNSWIKMFIDSAHRPIGFELVQYFHPVFLYESVLLLAAFIVYLIFARKLQSSALIYTLVIYSLIRIIVEFWRIDYQPIFLRLDLAQLVGFGIIIVVFMLGLTFRKKPV